jgi:FMN phosphatase YigB (HAD superfamily)
MIIVDKESTIFVDVDDTLVMWGVKAKKGQRLIQITDPYSNEQLYLLPHAGHIKVLKDRKARGSCIIVWSAGGYKWAKKVVEALKLTDYVDLVMTKPHMYIDDKPASEFMQERLYLSHESGYGR